MSGQDRWWEDDGIMLEIEPDVWRPTYFGRNFKELTEQIVIRRIREHGHCRVLDFGCGSGILALAAAGLGAEVTATDFNPSAVKLTLRNAELNDVKIDVREGDRFEAIGNGEKFDLIVANTPSIPGRVGTDRSSADEWNENGSGRLLLDSVLIDGPAFLHGGGTLLTANNSEQNLAVTQKLLASRWCGYRTLRRCTFELDLDQFEPFRDKWVADNLARKIGDRYIHFVHFIEAWT